MEQNILPTGLSPDTVQTAVRERYDHVAREPKGEYNFRVGREFAEALGYPRDLLEQLPAEAVDAFTGVGTPSLIANVQPGETVVDLGCGAGLDLAILSRKVGTHGRAIGIDFAPTMVERASRNVHQLGLAQAQVYEARADQTGLPDASADWVVANGILNLSPDKTVVIREIARLLRPGGHFLLAETTLRAPLRPGEVSTIDDWFR